MLLLVSASSYSSKLSATSLCILLLISRRYFFLSALYPHIATFSCVLLLLSAFYFCTSWYRTSHYLSARPCSLLNPRNTGSVKYWYEVPNPIRTTEMYASDSNLSSVNVKKRKFKFYFLLFYYRSYTRIGL